MNYSKLKPAVNRKLLLVISGLMWSSVGIFLNILAFGWLNSLNNTQIFLSILIGIMIGLVIARFGFGNIAKKMLTGFWHTQNKLAYLLFKNGNHIS